MEWVFFLSDCMHIAFRDCFMEKEGGMLDYEIILICYFLLVEQSSQCFVYATQKKRKIRTDITNILNFNQSCLIY